MYCYPSPSAVALGALTFLYIAGVVGARPVQPDAETSQTLVHPSERPTHDPEQTPESRTVAALRWRSVPTIRTTHLSDPQPGPAPGSTSSHQPPTVATTWMKVPTIRTTHLSDPQQGPAPVSTSSHAPSALGDGTQATEPAQKPSWDWGTQTSGDKRCEAATIARQESSEERLPFPDLTQEGCLDPYVEPCPEDPTGAAVHCIVCGKHSGKGRTMGFLNHLYIDYPDVQKSKKPVSLRGLFSRDPGFGRPQYENVANTGFDARQDAARNGHAEKRSACEAKTRSIRESSDLLPAPTAKMKGLDKLRDYWEVCPDDAKAAHCKARKCGCHLVQPERYFSTHLKRHYPKDKSTS